MGCPSEALAGPEVWGDIYITLVAASIFWGVFCLFWWAFEHNSPYFKNLDARTQADLVSKVSSTIHAVIVVVGLQDCMWSNEWDAETFSCGSPFNCRSVFSISIGYFLMDLFVVVKWKVPFWQVFVFHHVCASLPFMFNNFVPGASNSNFLLALFLQVELPTIFLNIGSMLELAGLSSSLLFAANFYVMFASWICTRLVMPVYIIREFIVTVMPEWGGLSACIVVDLVCGLSITLFCYGTFFYILCPDLKKRWATTPLQDKLKSHDIVTPSVLEEGGLSKNQGGGGTAAAGLESDSLLGHNGGASTTPGGGGGDIGLSPRSPLFSIP